MTNKTEIEKSRDLGFEIAVPPIENAKGKKPASHLLALSAPSPEALMELANSYMNFLLQEETLALFDICYTANCHRAHQTERLAIVGTSRQDLAEQLSAYMQQADTIASRIKIEEQAKVVFVFSGQGAQWLGMGRELFQQNQTFCGVLQQCEQAFRPWVDWSLFEQLFLDEDSPSYRLNEIGVIQPVLFAIQVALAAIWRSWGIEPSAVIGHSMGEVAAAYESGAFTLEVAAQIICKRSQIIQQISGQGAMALIGLPIAEAEEIIKGYESKLSIAVHNSPRSVVLSGDPDALEVLLDELRAKDIFCRKVKIEVAAHGPQTDPLRPELVASLAGLQTQTTAIPFYSTVTHEIIDGSALNAEYWGENLRQPVQFANTIQTLIERDHVVFIEMSPHPLLLASIQEVANEVNKPIYGISSIRRDQPEMSTILGGLGSLYCLGYSIDWNKLFPSGGRVVSLPTHPGQHRHFDRDLNRGSASLAKNHSTNVYFDQQLLDATRDQREQQLRGYLQRQVARLLRIPPAKIATDRSFSSYDLDSLMAMEFRNQLESDLRLRLSTTLVWNYPTIDQLTSYLVERLSARSESEKAKILLSTLNQLSDDEVDALLKVLMIEEEKDS